MNDLQVHPNLERTAIIDGPRSIIFQTVTQQIQWPTCNGVVATRSQQWS
jgi:hypothetical protein